MMLGEGEMVQVSGVTQTQIAFESRIASVMMFWDNMGRGTR